jgi:chorismate--pyruvate lyase
MQKLRAAWHAHLPYDASIPLNQRRWITGEGSLTARLMSASPRFRVRRLAQAPQLPFADEWQALGLIRPLPAITREVLLICDETPAVFAHIVDRPPRAARLAVPARAGQPAARRRAVRRSARAARPIPVCTADPCHPLRQALQRVLPALSSEPMLPARRSVFRRAAAPCS